MSLITAFETLVEAAKISAAEKNPLKAFQAAKQLGLIEQSNDRPSAQSVYELSEGNRTL
jgi:hypothetical protein